MKGAKETNAIQSTGSRRSQTSSIVFGENVKCMGGRSAIPGFKTGWPPRFHENAGRGEGGAPNAVFALLQSSMLHD